MQYRGELFVEENQAVGGLPVEIVLMDRELAVQQGGELLGKYPLSETRVSRLSGEQFQLTIGSESLIFSADDALGFSYEGLPFIEAGGSHPASTGFRRAVRKFLRSPSGQTDDLPSLAVVPDLDSQFPEPEADPAYVESVEVASPSVESAVVGSSLEVPVEDVAPWLEVVSDTPTVREPEVVSPISAVPTPAPPPPPVRPVEVEIPAEPASVPVPTPVSVPEPTPSVPLAQAEPPSPLNRGCSSQLSDGSACPMEPMAGRGLCFSHMQERDAVHVRVDRRSKAVISDARDSQLPDLDDVVSRLEHAVTQVHEGLLDPQQALAMASLVQAMVDTIELGKS